MKTLTPCAFTLGELAERLKARLVGDSDRRVTGLATLLDAGPNDITFLANKTYLKYLPDTRAAAVLVHPAHGTDAPCARLELENP